MVIDMNVSRLDTIEQIQEFLNGTTEIVFSNPSDESALRSFVATVIKRYRYFKLTKGQRGILFAYMRLFTTASVPTHCTVSPHQVAQAATAC